MAGFDRSLYYPIFAVSLIIGVVLFILKEKYRDLFWPSSLWGFFACHIFIIIFGGLFKLFRWVEAHPFVFMHAPLLLNWPGLWQ